MLLHGFTGGAATWTSCRERLEGLHVIAPDLPGHGRSPSPPPDMGFGEAADAVVRVLDDAGVERAAWLGYSMGGRVALQIALRHPARVDRLIVESASPGIADEAERARRAQADSALADSIERSGLESFVERWAAQPLFATQARLSADLLAGERRVRLAGSARGLAAGLRVLGVGRQPSLWPLLGRIAAPVLLVVGNEDAKYVGLARSMVSELPDASLERVTGAGHTVHLERPVEFWNAVRAFLARGEDAS